MVHTYDDDELLVNYDDACIYGRDLRLIYNPSEEGGGGGGWLNDACIHFALKRLLADHQKKRAQHAHSNSLLLMDPAVLSFFMHSCQTDDMEDLMDFCQGFRNFGGVAVIFLPVNDSMTTLPQRVGQQGSHWSLLLATKLNKSSKDTASSLVFFHFDSVTHSGNERIARQIAAAFLKAWKICQANTTDLKPALCYHECTAVPQQVNGYDCGIHVLLTIEALLPVVDTPQDASDTATTDLPTLYTNAIVSHFFELGRQDHKESIADSCQKIRQRLADDIQTLAQVYR